MPSARQKRKRRQAAREGSARAVTRTGDHPSGGEERPGAGEEPRPAGARAAGARSGGSRSGGLYARAREKDDAARAALEPLREGERPLAVTIAAGVALVLGLTNIVAFAAGLEIRGDRPNAAAVIFYSGLMLVAAWGLWRARYWAVLGIQVLLGFLILIFAVLLVTATNVGAVVISLAVLAGAGTLFWFLIKAMARIQMPERRR